MHGGKLTDILIFIKRSLHKQFFISSLTSFLVRVDGYLKMFLLSDVSARVNELKVYLMSFRIEGSCVGQWFLLSFVG